MLFFSPATLLAYTGVSQIAAAAALPLLAPSFLQARVTPSALTASLALFPALTASAADKASFLLASGVSCLFFGNLLSSYEEPNATKMPKLCYLPLAAVSTVFAVAFPFTGWPFASVATLAAVYLAYQQ
eukprot:TRINITY_DN20448_c0_g1_i1.p1 TRINITY_DN20448_c0_g1~~TRINITY_DN20448_c0_g1_i1.p1  ORF type:complete len:129 (-),score=25.87 TRINITY_DN20448_c0_g1_i1:155-541(-)